MRLDPPLIRLPLRVDAARLAAEVAALPDGAWRGHPEGAPGNTACALVAASGDPTDDSTVGPMRPTPLLDALPYARRVLAGLGTTVGRTRLMRIAHETELTLHVDSNYYWWHHLRVHVPVVSSPDVVFQVGGQQVHMAPGEVWVFDTWQPHRVDNPASAARIHLVVDTVGSAALWDLLEHPERDAIDVVNEDGSAPALATETVNFPIVMSPWEVEATIAALGRDVDSVAANTGLTDAFAPFCHQWRDTWARYGDAPEGWPHFQRLVQVLNEQLDAVVGEVRLANGVLLVEAVRQLVVRAAVNPDLARSPRSAPRVPAQPAAQPVTEADVLERRLQGAPRISDPVFIVSAPRSGSTLLFETMARAPDVYTIGGESHRLIESIRSLRPDAHGWESNRLTEDDASEGVTAQLKDAFVMRLRDRDGRRPLAGPTRMLEKTPKNALRVPFLAAAFPDARFVYLYRDPRETTSSMLDAWRSRRFVTYPDLPGWHGDPWSLLLVPGWPDLDGLPLGAVVVEQWARTTTQLLDDLEVLDPQRWCVASYDRLVADPMAEVGALCTFLGLDWDADLVTPLPESQHTLDSPHPDKWLRNAPELEPHWDRASEAVARSHAVFAEPPRTAPVAAAARTSTVAAPRAAAIGAEPDAVPGAVDPTTYFGSTHTLTFADMLRELPASVVVSTYQSGNLIFARALDDGLNTHFRSLQTPMGMAYDGRRLAVGTRAEVIVFQNQPALSERLDPPGAHDACFVPRVRHHTGDLRVHDLAWAGDELWIVNTRFSCLATLDADSSFVPRWRPPFVSALAAEDRCHLNGLAVVDGRPAYVTVLGITDEQDGWREHKASGGALLDVETSETVAVGLSMPHSPRWHDDRLWVLESGIGALCTVDVATGAIERVASVPGFARGLTFVGKYALVGLSRVREHVFDGLPLTRDRTEPLQCGVWVVDTETGGTVATLSFEGVVQELFEVVLLPGMRSPELLEPGAPLAETAFVLPDEALTDVRGAGPAGG